MLSITIEGPKDSGKSHLIALLGKYLKQIDCNVTIQGEETHNAGTLSLEESELIERLKMEQIIIKEMRTSL